MEKYKGRHVKINLEYEKRNINRVDKVIIEKYDIDLNDEIDMTSLNEVIKTQQVLQRIGGKTANVSGVFHVGGPYIKREPHIIDITKGSIEEYPFLIDVDTNLESHIYIYRVITYWKFNNEFATRYIGGIFEDKSIFDKEDGERGYLRYLTMDDMMDLLPLNYKALIRWVKYKCMFRETYKLRRKGIIESHKFSAYMNKNFVDINFIDYIRERVEAYENKTKKEILE